MDVVTFRSLVTRCLIWVHISRQPTQRSFPYTHCKIIFGTNLIACCPSPVLRCLWHPSKQTAEMQWFFLTSKCRQQLFCLHVHTGIVQIRIVLEMCAVCLLHQSASNKQHYYFGFAFHTRGMLFERSLERSWENAWAPTKKVSDSAIVNCVDRVPITIEQLTVAKGHSQIMSSIQRYISFKTNDSRCR